MKLKGLVECTFFFIIKCSLQAILFQNLRNFTPFSLETHAYKHQRAQVKVKTNTDVRIVHRYVYKVKEFSQWES